MIWSIISFALGLFIEDKFNLWTKVVATYNTLIETIKNKIKKG